MTLKSVTGPSFVVLSSLLFACASQPQQPAAPEALRPQPTSAKPSTPEPESSATPAESASLAAAEATPPESAVTPEPEPAPAPTPQFSPLAILTAPQTAFLIDYGNSPAKERAQKFCTDQVNATADNEGDEDAQRQKLATCLAKERTKFTADVIRFRMDDRGSGTVTIYRRNGSSLPEVYVAKVQYKETSKDAVKVIVKGGLSGSRPICRDRQDLDVKVPNGYSIELDDSFYGKLTYDAKVGLVAN